MAEITLPKETTTWITNWTQIFQAVHIKMIINTFSMMDCVLLTKTFIFQEKALRLVGMFVAFLKTKKTYYIWKHLCVCTDMCTKNLNISTLCCFAAQSLRIRSLCATLLSKFANFIIYSYTAFKGNAVII